MNTIATSGAQRVVAPIWRLAVKGIDPLVVLQEGTIDAGVYCVHPVTGDIGGLRTFARHVGDVRLYGIQVPRERMNEAAAHSIEAMAARYVTLVTTQSPRGPIHLVGWSAGAIVALEMARQLRAVGREVPLLVALDGAPCNTGAGLKRWNPRYAIRLARNLPRWIRDDRQQDWSPRGILRRIEGKLAYRFGTGKVRLRSVQTMDAETIRRLAEGQGWRTEQKAFMHAFYRAMIDYIPQRYDGRVLVYETRTQPLIHLRQIGAAWSAIATDIEIVPVPGNHTGMVADPSAGLIARHFASRLTAPRAARV